MAATKTALPATVDDAPPDVVGLALSNPRHEMFAQHLVAGLPARSAYVAAGYGGGARGAQSHAWQLAARPDIRRRVGELLAPAAAAIDKSAHLLLLDMVARADPTELSYPVTKPCPLCWPAERMTAVVGAALQAHAPMPDLTAPDEQCAACEGYGLTRTVITDSRTWSPAARALFDSASTDRFGVTTIKTKDQARYAQMLAERLYGWQAPRQSENLNLNANVDVPANAKPETLLAAIRRSRARLVEPGEPNS